MFWADPSVQVWDKNQANDGKTLILRAPFLVNKTLQSRTSSSGRSMSGRTGVCNTRCLVASRPCQESRSLAEWVVTLHISTTRYVSNMVLPRCTWRRISSSQWLPTAFTTSPFPVNPCAIFLSPSTTSQRTTQTPTQRQLI